METKVVKKSSKENIKKIYLGNHCLSDENASKIVEDIVFSNSYSKLAVYINSTGGDVTNGIAIVDALSMVSRPTLGVAIGSCMSMAVNLFLSTKYRVCTPSTYFMIHQSVYAEGELKGQIETIKEAIKIQEDIDRMLNSYIFKNTLITKDILDDYFKHKTDMYFNAKEALEYGIVNRIVKNDKEIDKILKELT